VSSTPEYYERSTLPQQGHRVTSKHKPKYISHMAQYLRLLLPSPSSSPTFPCDIASVKHRPLQRFNFFHNPNSLNHTIPCISCERSLALNLNPTNVYSLMPFLLLGEPMRIQHVYNQNRHQQYILVSYSLFELQLIGLLF
jgi:hypothetical protein